MSARLFVATERHANEREFSIPKHMRRAQLSSSASMPFVLNQNATDRR